MDDRKGARSSPEPSGRQRHNSLSSTGKKPSNRRRSRSLQLDKTDDIQFEEKPPQKKYVSMAEAVYKFHRSTPDRFRTKPVIDGSQRRQAGTVNQSDRKPRCTVPHPPNLTSHLRARPVAGLSKEQREDAELQEMPKHMLKTVPLKVAVSKEPQQLQNVDPKPRTKPGPRQVTEVTKLVVAGKPDDSSKTNNTEKNISQDEQQPIRAAECSTVHPVWEKKVSEGIIDEKLEQPGVKRAACMKRVTIPTPFSFEERDKEMIKQKEEKIRKVLEEERKAREFRARQIPESVKCSRPQLSIRSHSPTRPEPFHLHTEERGQLHQAAWKAKLEDDERRAAEAARFIAGPPVVLQKKPFEPEVPHRILQGITDIHLYTEMRAKEREKFETKMEEKERLKEELKRRLIEEQNKKEEEEIAKMRSEAIHKARPMPKYPHIVPKPTKE